uniref:G5-like ORF's protein n=1 Tax=Dictyostelium mucoroides TaxID=31287 RepID=Q24015_DICMU|nr:G5-like ORF's protein [Dictyostelium mucoroides]
MDQETHNINFNNISKELKDVLINYWDDEDDKKLKRFLKPIYGCIYDRSTRKHSLSRKSFINSTIKRFISNIYVNYDVRDVDGEKVLYNKIRDLKVYIGPISRKYHFYSFKRHPFTTIITPEPHSHLSIGEMVKNIQREGYYITRTDIYNAFQGCVMCIARRRKDYVRKGDDKVTNETQEDMGEDDIIEEDEEDEDDDEEEEEEVLAPRNSRRVSKSTTPVVPVKPLKPAGKKHAQSKPAATPTKLLGRHPKGISTSDIASMSKTMGNRRKQTIQK